MADRQFHDRHFPVRTNLDQLKHQAKDLLRALRRGDATAAAELTKHHPEPIEPSNAKLAHAQLALARSYGLPERFHGPRSHGHDWVSKPAMRLIAQRGGHV